MGIKLNLESFSIAGKPFNKPVIISGPCSAESEEQVLAVARELSAMGIKIFRAGIWKPRTRPNAFEGVGTEGLNWLRRVKAETGMFTAVEVANVKHVYDTLKYGVDVIWIGARTNS
jgi:chorismate mutase